MTDDESVSAVERERMQRMAACWRESRPSGTAISSARRRFVRATAVTTVTFASLCASFAYGTVGALIVVGGGHVASTWTARGQGHRIEEAQSARAESAASTRHEAMRESATPIETPNGVVAPGEPATAAPLPNAAALDPAPMRAMQRAAASVPQVPPTPAARVNASAAVGDAEIAAPPHAEASAWQRAAAALERHDSVAADQALGELTTQPDARVMPHGSLKQSCGRRKERPSARRPSWRSLPRAVQRPLSASARKTFCAKAKGRSRRSVDPLPPRC